MYIDLVKLRKRIRLYTKTLNYYYDRFGMKEALSVLSYLQIITEKAIDLNVAYDTFIDLCVEDKFSDEVWNEIEEKMKNEVEKFKDAYEIALFMYDKVFEKYRKLEYYEFKESKSDSSNIRELREFLYDLIKDIDDSLQLSQNANSLFHEIIEKGKKLEQNL